ncbi:MAG: hypothetical protein COB98_04535 [Flavobacteriaceae bacterium]|nr:MAG: hypothetical protein COB98_04535 [Flavobacteriaceae bacterium]
MPSIDTLFMSVVFLGVISRKLKENLFLQIEPGFVWTDPVGMFRSRGNWQVAGEDLNFLVQIGIKYRM